MPRLPVNSASSKPTTSRVTAPKKAPPPPPPPPYPNPTQLVDALKDPSKVDAALADLFASTLFLNDIPKPTTSTTERRIASTATRSAVRPASAKPSKDASPSLSDPERASLAMQGVNASLKSLASLVTSQWRPPTTSRAAISKPTSRSRQPPASFAIAPDAEGESIGDGNGCTKESVEALVRCCSTSLRALRSLKATVPSLNGGLNVEKAALNFIGSLVEIELFELALDELSSMHQQVESFYPARPIDPSKTVTSSVPSNATKGKGKAPPTVRGPAASSRAPRPTNRTTSSANERLIRYTALVLFRPPEESYLIEKEDGVGEEIGPKIEEVVNLIVMGQLHALAALLKGNVFEIDRSTTEVKIQAILENLSAEGGPTAWHRRVEESSRQDQKAKAELMKRPDAVLSTLFGTLMKGSNRLGSNIAPSITLNIRLHACLCMLQSRHPSAPSTNKLDWFWDQASKAIWTFVKEKEADSSLTSTAKVARNAFIELRVDAERIWNGGNRGEARTRTRPKGFVAICDLLTHLAKQTDNFEMIQEISSLLSVVPAPALQNSPLATTVTDQADVEMDEDVDSSVARLSARLTSATALVERFLKTGKDESCESQLDSLASDLPTIATVRSKIPSTSPLDGKLDRSFERLRWACVRVLKDKASVGNPMESVMVKTLDNLVGVVEAIVESFPSEGDRTRIKDVISGALDSLSFLANHRLKGNDRGTFDLALRTLERSCRLIGAPETLPQADYNSSAPLVAPDPHWYRCVCSALYNAGGTLYNESKPADAAAFLAKSCELAEYLLQSTEGAEVGADKDVQNLRDSLPRRWELLGLCCSSTSDFKLAFQSFTRAIRAEMRNASSSLVQATQTRTPNAIAKQSPVLTKLLQRRDHTAVLDLLLPPAEVSLQQMLEQDPKLSPEVRGIVLELQLLSLEKLLHKQEGIKAFLAILRSLLDTYPGDEYPIRRVRVLCRCAEQASTMEDSPYDPTAVAAEITSLLSGDEMSSDAGLKGSSLQYAALSSAWRTIYRCSRPESMSSAEFYQCARSTIDYFDRVLSKATKMVITEPTPPRPDRRRISGASSRRTSSAGMKAPLASIENVSVNRPPPSAELKTPPRKTALNRNTSKSPVTPAKTSSVSHFDDISKARRCLRTLASLLSISGHPVLRVACMQLVTRLEDADRAESTFAEFTPSSLELASELLSLGKTSQAGLLLAQADSEYRSHRDHVGAKEQKCLLSLCYAEYHALLGNNDKSASAYDQASRLSSELAQGATTGKDMSRQRILQRCMTLYRSSRAAATLSAIQQRKGNLSAAVAAISQAARLADRAMHNMCRLVKKPLERAPSPDLFTVSRHLTSDDGQPVKRQQFETSGLRSPIGADLAWALVDMQMRMCMRMTALMMIHGSFKAAMFHAQSTVDLCNTLALRPAQGRALVLRASVQVLAGRSTEASSDLQEAESLILMAAGELGGIEIARCRGDLHLHDEQLEAAFAHFTKCHTGLDLLNREVNDLISTNSHSVTRKSSPISAKGSPSATKSDMVFPHELVHVLCQRAWLATVTNAQDEVQGILRSLAMLRMSKADRANEQAILGEIGLSRLLATWSKDPMRGLITEASLSLPSVWIAHQKSNQHLVKLDCSSELQDIDTFLQTSLHLAWSSSSPHRIRRSLFSLAFNKLVQASLNSRGKSASFKMPDLLDDSAAVTCSRDIVDSIPGKFERARAPEDLTWPSMDTLAGFLPQPAPEDEDEEEDAHLLPQYWSAVSHRHQTRQEPNGNSPSISSILPENWVVVSAHATPDRKCLVLARHQAGHQPQLFRLPFNRFAAGDDEPFTLDAVMGSLKEIIAHSNRTSRVAKDLQKKEDRINWWKERKELDKNLGELLEGVESRWLGGFKSVFLDSAVDRSSGAFSAFKTTLLRLFTRFVTRTKDQRALKVALDDAIAERISALSGAISEEDNEDLEDVIHYLVDSFQFMGIHIDRDDMDIDVVAIDLREALKTLQSSADATGTERRRIEHLFLVLDNTLQSLPWESLPVLRGRSVSRIPSTKFLQDRLELRGVWSGTSSNGASSSDPTTFPIDVNKSFYVLNPSGDLANTQTTFSPWLEKRGWAGTVGRAPLEEELKKALTRNDLFIYFGHGGGEQYIRSRVLRHLPRCAVSMLWGCSSGLLEETGDFDIAGTPWNYMIAGCPALVANLWDVTDKDIDRLAQRTFQLMGCDDILPTTDPSSSTAPIDHDGRARTITEAVAEAREACNLKYLNGAAPVVFGIPVSFAR